MFLLVVVLCLLHQSVALCPNGCHCSFNSIRCASIDSLELTVGSRYWSEIELKDVKLASVSCGQRRHLMRITKVLLQNVHPDNLACQVLHCDPWIAKIAILDKDVSASSIPALCSVNLNVLSRAPLPRHSPAISHRGSCTCWPSPGAFSPFCVGCTFIAARRISSASLRVCEPFVLLLQASQFIRVKPFCKIN